MVVADLTEVHQLGPDLAGDLGIGEARLLRELHQTAIARPALRQRHGRQRRQPKRWHVGRLDRVDHLFGQGDRGNQRRNGIQKTAQPAPWNAARGIKRTCSCGLSRRPLYQHTSLKTRGGKVD